MPRAIATPDASLANKRVVTSLGDVVQTLPVVADLHRAFPGVTVDWAHDESCAEVVRWHPGVSHVLCAPLRRFKKMRNGGDLKVISASIGALRAHRYDAVIDLHGVYKSAIISSLARAERRVGYQTQDLGETSARFAYSHRFGPRPDCDAWHGMRVSAGEALGVHRARSCCRRCRCANWARPSAELRWWWGSALTTSKVGRSECGLRSHD